MKIYRNNKNSVTSSSIADGSILDVDVNAAAAIAESKIASLTTDLAAKAPLASPTFTGTVAAATVATTGDASLGDAAGDKFLTHGAATSGAQSVIVAAPAATGSALASYGYTQAQADAISAAVIAMRTCLINHGLMAAS